MLESCPLVLVLILDLLVELLRIGHTLPYMYIHFGIDRLPEQHFSPGSHRNITFLCTLASCPLPLQRFIQFQQLI